MSLRGLAGAVALATVLLGCGEAVESEPPVETVAPPTAPATPSGDRVELIVFAAASLRNVLAAAKATFEADHPGTTITVAADSSAALRTQIEQGASADVFLSADASNPDRLVEAGLTDGAGEVFASNGLALVVPVANPAGIEAPSDLARPGVKIVAGGLDVPLTGYVDDLVARLGAVPGYPSDFVAAYRSNIVSREDNVRAVLAKLELGEGDAGFVYVTDAVTASEVRVVPLPGGLNVRAVYVGVVLRSSAEPAAARRFLDWIAGPDGQGVLAGFGFGPPP